MFYALFERERLKTNHFIEQSEITLKQFEEWFTMTELSFIPQRPKKWTWGPLLDKTGLQNRTNKNHVTSKTADKNCNRK